MRSRNRQIKELKKQSTIATRNDYDLVEGNEKSHRNQKENQPIGSATLAEKSIS